jgi:hypothetical protein
MTDSLTKDTITFGKYKDLTLVDMLRDRKYCSWLLLQPWFKDSYEYLYNSVKAHNPEKYFLTTTLNKEKFLETYPYFYLKKLKDLELTLTEDEKKCYSFYLETVQNLKDKIMGNIDTGENPYQIKAPTSWLKNFEKQSGLNRDIFKEFISAYNLPNITKIVEDIKTEGGISYKGAKSYIIAKEKSKNQEKFWEDILKTKYGEDIGVQYKFNNCFFDFIRISNKILYECKLGFKDYNKKQHNKYLSILGNFNLIYLIDRDCIVDISKKQIYTTDRDKYVFMDYPDNDLTQIIQKFKIVEVKDIKDYL